jgi:hypothetical protein
MNSRSLYYFILRLHPAHFRDKFEDQMLWIFDESVASRGAASLLIDAVVSLVRQWVLRSGYRRHAQPSLAMDGATALTEELRRNAETLHRRAWRLNLLWLVCGFAIYLIIPLSSHWNPIVLMVFITIYITYSKNRRGIRPPEPGLPSLRPSPDARTMYRRQLEGKRDGLGSWNGSFTMKNINLFGGGVLVLLVVMHVALLAKLHYRPYLSIDRVRLWESSTGLVILAAYWLFMKRCNERAARAIQQEIDALEMGDSATPQSV